MHYLPFIKNETPKIRCFKIIGIHLDKSHNGKLFVMNCSSNSKHLLRLKNAYKLIEIPNYHEALADEGFDIPTVQYWLGTSARYIQGSGYMQILKDAQYVSS